MSLLLWGVERMEKGHIKGKIDGAKLSEMFPAVGCLTRTFVDGCKHSK